MANVARLVELSMVPPLAKEVATQIDGATGTYTDTSARNAIKTKTQVAALVSPVSDYADLTAATAAIKSIIDALKA
jgi:hypothetical protein